MTETQMIDAVTIYEVLAAQHENIKRLEGEAKVLRDLLGLCQDVITDVENDTDDIEESDSLRDLLLKIAKAIRGTV